MAGAKLGKRPFEGLRVVDFTQVLAGPYTTYQLACMGADVVKIEQPGGGDQGRHMFSPVPGPRAAGMSALFTAVNSGKRSLSLDLKNDAAAQVVERLVAGADVVVENFKAGTMDKLGFGAARLRQLNPRLIYCAVSGYGQDGPRAGAAAYDPVVQAASGMMSVNGYEHTGPTKVGFWVVDMSTGMCAAFAIASALYRRQLTGEGETIDASMMETAVSILSPQVGLSLNFGLEPGLTGNGSPGSGGPSTVYRTRDGYLTIAAVTPAQFRAMFRAVGLEALVDDPRYATAPARNNNADSYREAMEGAFAADSAASWQARLAAVGVPASRNQRMGDLRDDPQLRHRQTFTALPPPPGFDKDFFAVNLGFKYAAGGPAVTSPPPTAGQHTDAVLGDLGFAGAEIEALRASGAIG